MYVSSDIFGWPSKLDVDGDRIGDNLDADINADGVADDLNGNGVDDGEPRVPGVTVTLTGTDGMGNAVNIPATTNGSGDYWFMNLAPNFSCTRPMVNPGVPRGTRKLLVPLRIPLVGSLFA